jgi:anaphase-promoting complex subunit 10
MPVLRAHLVQIKILENHQNGKDTHLRGLQVFARSEEREGRGEMQRRGKVGVVGGDGGRKGMEKGGVNADVHEDLDKYELGLGGFEEDTIR